MNVWDCERVRPCLLILVGLRVGSTVEVGVGGELAVLVGEGAWVFERSDWLRGGLLGFVLGLVDEGLGFAGGWEGMAH